MIRKGAAHWPTKSAQWFLFDNLRTADIAIEPSASPKNKLEGTVDVCRSIAPVTRSSFACPRSTLVSMNFSLHSLSHAPKVERYRVETRFTELLAGIIAVAPSCALVSMWTQNEICTLDGPSPHHKVQDQRDNREHQQQVDQTPCCVEHGETAKPSNKQNYE